MTKTINMNNLQMVKKINETSEQLAEMEIKESVIKCGYIPNFIKKCINGTAKGVFLGDSITDAQVNTPGAGSSGADKGYAYLTTKMIREKYGNGVTMLNRGIAGNSLKVATQRIANEILPYNYDLVIIALGTNDWNYSNTLEQFEKDYRYMIETLRGLTDADILCIGAGWFKDWVSPTANPISEEEYNKIIKRICVENKIGYVDMYNAMKNCGLPWEDITMSNDPVHPNDEGHKVWAKELFTWFDFVGYMNEINVKKELDIKRSYASEDLVNLTYSGDWYSHNGGNIAFNKNLMSTTSIGDRFVYTFVGDVIKVHFFREVGGGQVRIWLDGFVIHDIYDLYSVSTTVEPLIIQASSNTEHMLEVELLPTKNENSVLNKCSLLLIDNYIKSIAEKGYNAFVLYDRFKRSYYIGKDVSNAYYFGIGTNQTTQNEKLRTVLFTRCYCSKFKIIYMKHSNYSEFDVYVDGLKKTTVDSYSSSAEYNQELEIELDSLDNHEILIKTNGIKNSGSNYGFNITGILCYSENKLMFVDGADNISIKHYFYETPSVQITPTANCNYYLEYSDKKETIIRTVPDGVGFKARIEGN